MPAQKPGPSRNVQSWKATSVCPATTNVPASAPEPANCWRRVSYPGIENTNVPTNNHPTMRAVVAVRAGTVQALACLGRGAARTCIR